MHISVIRGGRMCRWCLFCLVILPLLYLLTTWSDSHKRLEGAYQAKFGVNRNDVQHSEDRNKEIPVLVEGKLQ